MVNNTITIIGIIVSAIIIGYIIYSILKPSSGDVTYETDSDVDVDSEDENTLDDGKEEGQEEVLNSDEPLFKAIASIPTFALIFGNSETDPRVYGDKNRLNGVAADLKRVHSLLKSYQGVKNTYGKDLTTSNVDTFDLAKATSSAYVSAIQRVAELGKNIKGDKLFIIYESGHGSQTFDKNDNDEDRMSETRVFYDGVVKDDQTREFILKTLGKGWKVLNVVDRCHSGGLAKEGFGSTDVKVKTIGVTDKSLLADIPQNDTDVETGALMKIQSAAKEGTYALDYGASMGGLFTYYWVEAIVAKSGNITYEDANNYAVQKCVKKQVPELQDVLNTSPKKWTNKKKILN